MYDKIHYQKKKKKKRNAYSKFLLLLLCVYTAKTWLLQLNICNSSVKGGQAGAVSESCHKKARQAYSCATLQWVSF